MAIPDLRKLRHAVVIAEMNNFARASDRLHLTPSALTRSIQSLEQELGITLFDRSRKGATPTPEGLRILVLARELLLQAQDLERETELLKNSECGEVAFGLGPAMSSALLPNLLVDISTLYPKLSMDIAVESPTQLLAMLRDAQVEFFIAGIGQLPDLNGRAYEAEILTEMRPEFFVRRDHPLAEAPRVKKADLARYPLLSPSRRPQDHLARQPSRVVNSTHVRCNDPSSLRHLALKTNAVLSGLKAMVAKELADGTIRRLRMEEHEDFKPSPIALVTLAGGRLSRYAELIRLLVTSHIRAVC